MSLRNSSHGMRPRAREQRGLDRYHERKFVLGNLPSVLHRGPLKFRICVFLHFWLALIALALGACAQEPEHPPWQCNQDRVCDPGENQLKCPDDCVWSEATGEGDATWTDAMDTLPCAVSASLYCLEDP